MRHLMAGVASFAALFAASLAVGMHTDLGTVLFMLACAAVGWSAGSAAASTGKGVA